MSEVIVGQSLLLLLPIIAGLLSVITKCWTIHEFRQVYQNGLGYLVFIGLNMFMLLLKYHKLYVEISFGFSYPLKSKIKKKKTFVLLKTVSVQNL